MICEKLTSDPSDHVSDEHSGSLHTFHSTQGPGRHHLPRGLQSKEECVQESSPMLWSNSALSLTPAHPMWGGCRINTHLALEIKHDASDQCCSKLSHVPMFEGSRSLTQDGVYTLGTVTGKPCAMCPFSKSL